MSLTICFLAFCIVHTLYWIVLFARLSFVDQPKDSDQNQLISVVIVFKNEIDNLKVLIPTLLEQDHPNFEVILCDDFSVDDSVEYVESIDDLRIRSLKAKADLPGKKAALKEAIAFALGDAILLTDADCYPASKSWIRSMSSQLRDKEVVLGYSPHLDSPGWLNKFIRYETYLVALQYFSYALAGMPYMGVGRNLLYKRSLFVSSDALDRFPGLVSGDDDIFVNAVAGKDNTNILLDPNSFVYTYPPKTFSAFVRQKRRHVTTASVYKPLHQILLAVYAVTHIMLYLLLIIGVFSGIGSLVIFGFLAVVLIKWFIAGRSMKVLQCEDLFLIFPILDFCMVLYYILLTPATFIKSKNW